MNRLMRLMRLHRLMDEAGDGSGSEGGGGGDGSGTAGDGGKSGESGAGDGAGEGGEGKAGNKPTDAEAKLVREVMDKKTKLKNAETALAQANARLAEFDGIDPVAAKKARDDQKAAETARLEAQGNWDALKKQMNDANELALNAKNVELQTERDRAEALSKQIADLTVGNSFGQSKYVREELVTPAKARQLFGPHFEFDGEKVVGYDKPAGAKGRTMLIDGKGEPLGFEQAMQKIVEADPDRDELLKSKARSGAGSRTEGHGRAPEKQTSLTAKDKISAGLKSFAAKK